MTEPIFVPVPRYDAAPEALRAALRKEWEVCDIIVRSDGWTVFGPSLDPVAVQTAVDGWAVSSGASAASDPDDEFRAAIKAATSLADLKAALLGTSGPGAEPRRGP